MHRVNTGIIQEHPLEKETEEIISSKYTV